MQTSSTFLRNSFRAALTLFVLLPLTSCLRSDDSSLALARTAVAEPYRDQVFWIKASGTPEKLTTWTYYFYDPTAPGKARLVRIVDGRVDRVQPAEFKITPQETLVFDPKAARVSEAAALAAIRAHAAKAQITCDQVRLQLRRPSAGTPPAWRAELYQGDRFAGTVYLSETDATVVRYDPSKPASAQTGAEKFAKDVETTFKGIGGDLEEFFTGERTVDK
jgi:hypothetical protein